jgi:hypothetical protein
VKKPTSPSPWEGREVRAGRALFWSPIQRGPLSPNTNPLPPRFVVPPQRLSLRQGEKSNFTLSLGGSRGTSGEGLVLEPHPTWTTQPQHEPFAPPRFVDPPQRPSLREGKKTDLTVNRAESKTVLMLPKENRQRTRLSKGIEMREPVRDPCEDREGQGGERGGVEGRLSGK